MNRRDLMKFFGAGALIAPAAAAAPIVRLIEPPTVELVSHPVVIRPIKASDILSFDVTLHKRDGSVDVIRRVAVEGYGLASTADDVRLSFIRRDERSVSCEFLVAAVVGARQ